MSDEEKLLREALDVLRDLREQDEALRRGDSLSLTDVFGLLQKLETYHGG